MRSPGDIVNNKNSTRVWKTWATVQMKLYKVKHFRPLFPDLPHIWDLMKVTKGAVRNWQTNSTQELSRLTLGGLLWSQWHKPKIQCMASVCLFDFITLQTDNFSPLTTAIYGSLAALLLATQIPLSLSFALTTSNYWIEAKWKLSLSLAPEFETLLYAAGSFLGLQIQWKRCSSFWYG